MGKYKIICFYLLVLLVVGCNSKKKVFTSVTKEIDSVVVKTEQIKAPVLTDAVTIKELCKDSIPVQFKKIFVVNKDTVTVEVVDNSLEIKVNQLEKILSEREQQLVLREREIDTLSETTKYRINWNWVIGAYLLGIVTALIKPWRFI